MKGKQWGGQQRPQRQNIGAAVTNNGPANGVEVTYFVHQHKSDGSATTTPRHRCKHPDCVRLGP